MVIIHKCERTTCEPLGAGREYWVKVLLRNSRIGLFYAGRKHWVGKAEAAADLGTIERAAELSREESFEEMDIIVEYEDPGCEQVLPLKPRNVQREARGETGR
jgi:hypothetical protein